MSKLTKRECEVLIQLAMGRTASETGFLIGCSQRTVEEHAANACRKLNARNRTHAVALSLQGYSPMNLSTEDIRAILHELEALRAMQDHGIKSEFYRRRIDRLDRLIGLLRVELDFRTSLREAIGAALPAAPIATVKGEKIWTESR
jgi:DNA-binding CsgD family transcriptional regulator